jgi:flagellar motor switch protein FliM
MAEDQQQPGPGAATAAAPRQVLIGADAGRGDRQTPAKIVAYDFRNPVFLSEIDLRQLRNLHDDFVRYLSARLSLFLRMEFGLKVTDLTTQAYVTFTESLTSPTHLCLFRSEPLVGVGILDIHPRLALTIVDRLLGGKGNSVKADRPLTEIEVGLLGDIVQIMLEEWCRQWKGDHELNPTIVSHESGGHFLRTAPRDAIILSVAFEATFGDCTELIKIGIPYYTIEPLIKRFQAKRQKDTSIGVSAKEPHWQRSYDRISVPVRAQWDAFEVTLREITSMRVGDVIEMPSELFQRTRVLLNGVPKFIGAVGIDDDRVAVQITSKLPPQEEELSHAINH